MQDVYCVVYSIFAFIKQSSILILNIQCIYAGSCCYWQKKKKNAHEIQSLSLPLMDSHFYPSAFFFFFIYFLFHSRHESKRKRAF